MIITYIYHPMILDLIRDCLKESWLEARRHAVGVVACGIAQKFKSHGGLFVPGRSACPSIVPLHCPGAWAAVSGDSRVKVDTTAQISHLPRHRSLFTDYTYTHRHLLNLLQSLFHIICNTVAQFPFIVHLLLLPPHFLAFVHTNQKE